MTEQDKIAIEKQKLHKVYSISGRVLAIAVLLYNIYRYLFLNDGLRDLWLLLLLFSLVSTFLIIKFEVHPFSKGERKARYIIGILVAIIIIAISTFSYILFNSK